MSILMDGSTRLLVQGITGAEGSQHARRSVEYGTNVVAGVTPGRGGQKMDEVPVFNTVEQAARETGANVSIIFVPAAGAADAILEAEDAGIPLVICITEGVPVLDMVTVKRTLIGSKTRLIGPNCPGIITPKAKSRAGIMPVQVFTPGKVGVVSRSGTLVYEGVAQLTANGIGQSTSVGVGGDPIIGTSQREVLEMFNHDPETEAVVLIGEIGGNAEQDAAEYISSSMKKPVIAFIAGSTAPPGRRMGHAGAIISGNTGTAKAKKDALSAAGVTIVQTPAEIGATAKRVLTECGLF
ncbi:MAG TPA: succinate--CoA ligase subunit alpha [Dehalococcoidia bacterium]|nr:succinate--CoA ligase subunit alpha [Dehalococcoidia bacterium]